MSKKVTVGYRYHLGMHMVLCHGPIDTITAIEVDGKTAWTGNATGGRITVNAPELFGGESREGGVGGPVVTIFGNDIGSVGEVDIEMGTASQPQNDYLQRVIETAIPAFRGVVGVILRQVYIGQNPYLKRWSFWAKRIATRQNGIPQWYLTKAAIGNDMNPAHIIRECITDPGWGMGYPEIDVDDVSFAAAADKLYAEGMGMSMLWDRSIPIDEFIGTVLKHIDGALYVNRNTGKFVLSLARADYNIASLITLDESSIERITDFKRNTVGELTNSVTVVFWDATSGKNNSITVQDIALAAQQGSTVSTTIQYPGFTNSAIAAQVAARDLKAVSTPLASAVIMATRKAASLNIGDVFVMTWPRYGVVQMVMRVTNVELGTLDSNVVRISCVEDVFATSSAIYAAPPQSGWANPNTEPVACSNDVYMESPYWELVQRLGETAAQTLPATFGSMVATAVRPSSDSLLFKLYSNPGAGYEEAGSGDFCPYAVLSAAVTAGQKSFPIESGVTLNLVRIGSYAKIDNELFEVEAITGTSITAGRGVLDSVPAPHLAGAKIHFIDDFLETDNIEYASGETAKLKLLTVTGMGTLPIASAPERTFTPIAARAFKPYPPGKLRINTLAYPDAVPGDASIAFTWTHRDRLQQTATLIDTEAGDIGPEAGTTYTLRILSPTGTPWLAQPATPNNFLTLDIATLGSYWGRMRVTLYSSRDGVDSFQTHDHEFTRAGYGTAYGYAYGGA